MYFEYIQHILSRFSRFFSFTLFNFPLSLYLSVHNMLHKHLTDYTIMFPVYNYQDVLCNWSYSFMYVFLLTTFIQYIFRKSFNLCWHTNTQIHPTRQMNIKRKKNILSQKEEKNFSITRLCRFIGNSDIRQPSFLFPKLIRQLFLEM